MPEDLLAPDPHLAELLRILYLFEPADRDPRAFHSSLAILLAREGLRLDLQSRQSLTVLSLAQADLLADVLAIGDVEKLIRAWGHRPAGAFFAFVSEKLNEACVSRRLYLRGKMVASPKERKQKRSEWLRVTETPRRELIQETVTLALTMGPDTPLEWVWDLAETRPL